MATDTGTTQASTAVNTGQNALNSFDPKALGNDFVSGVNNLTGSQIGSGPSNSTDYMSAYKNQIAQNPTATGLLNTANTMYNVPGLAQNANTLNNAVLSAPQNSLDQAKGFQYDNNQVQNQTNLTLGRLSPLAQSATNQSQTAQTLANQFVNQGLTQNATNLLPVQQYGTMLSDALSRQMTGYTTAMQAEFKGLTDKMAQGMALSSLEMSRASDLAAYAQAYDTASKNQQYQPLTAGQTLVNTMAQPGTVPYRAK